MIATAKNPTTTITRARFGYMTNSVANLQTARLLAELDGYIVDMLPPDAPMPEPGTFDGIMVDLGLAAKHALDRKNYLKKLAQLAKVLPVVVYDQRATYQEAAEMRAAGIKWFPALRSRAFATLLAHPLGKVAQEAKAEREMSGMTSAAE